MKGATHDVLGLGQKVMPTGSRELEDRGAANPAIGCRHIFILQLVEAGAEAPRISVDLDEIRIVRSICQKHLRCQVLPALRRWVVDQRQR